MPAVSPSGVRSGAIAASTRSCRRASGCREVSGDTIQRGTLRLLAAGTIQAFDERRVEQVCQRLADRGVVRHAVDPLEGGVPPEHSIFEVEHHQPVVQRLNDVLVELSDPVDLGRLDLELGVQPAVLDRRGHLSGHGREQSDVLTAQRLAAGLRAQRQHRDRPFFGDARHEVVDPLGPPEVHVLVRVTAHRDRLVEHDGVPVDQPSPNARGPIQRWPVGGNACAAGAVRAEHPAGGIAGRSEHQHRVVEDQRLGDPSDQALGETVEVEIAVQVAGKPNERATIIVAVTVVDAVEHRLDGVLDRARHEHHDRRRQQGDDRVVAVGLAEKHFPGQKIQQEVDADHRRDRDGIDQPAFDDHLDVTQAIPHDRRCEGQRDEHQRNRREFEPRGIKPECPRQRVEQREWQPGRNRPPHDPAELAPRRHRRHPTQGENHQRQSGDDADRQIGELRPPDPLPPRS